MPDRYSNLRNVYETVLPQLAIEQSDMATALNEIHEAAMDGYTAVGLEGMHNHQTSVDPATISIAGLVRSTETTRLLDGYATAINGTGYEGATRKRFDLYLPGIAEPDLGPLMAKLFDRVVQIEDLQDSAPAVDKLAIWSSQLVALFHPYYDGNGRGTRGLFSYIRARNNQPLMCIEALEPATKPKSTFLTDVGLNLLCSLYARNLDAMPEYIPPTKKHITGEDILGIPSGIPSLRSIKQQSMLNLFDSHLDAVTPDIIDELIRDSTVHTYHEYADLLTRVP